MKIEKKIKGYEKKFYKFRDFLGKNKALKQDRDNVRMYKNVLRQGKLFEKQERYGDSLQNYEKALEIAKKIKNNYKNTLKHKRILIGTITLDIFEIIGIILIILLNFHFKLVSSTELFFILFFMISSIILINYFLYDDDYKREKAFANYQKNRY